MNLYLFVLFCVFVLIFVYSNFLYPLVFACFGFLESHSKSSKHGSEQELQPITLLVPAYNESAVILAKLKNIDTLEYPPGMLRVIVASDGSDDGTQEIVRSYQSNRPIELLDFQERRGKASIVNDALSQCTDPWVCLCDANVMFRPDALVRLATRLQLPRVGAVTGDVRLASDESDFGRGESLYCDVERAIQKGESFIGSVMGVRMKTELLLRKSNLGVENAWLGARFNRSSEESIRRCSISPSNLPNGSAINYFDGSTRWFSWVFFFSAFCWRSPTHGFRRCSV